MSTIPSELATYEYFRDEWHRFNEIMGSTKYTREQREQAFYGLALVAFACRDERVQLLFEVAADNYARRMVYIDLHEALTGKRKP